MGSGIRSRLIETVNRGDIGKLSKLFKVAPQLMGFPTRQDMANFFGMVLKKLPQEMVSKNENLINLSMLVEQISSKKTMENLDEYYANIRNELENPQYAAQREMLKNRLIDIYQNPNTAEML